MEIFLVLVVVGGDEKRDSTILELAQLLDVYDDLFPAKVRSCFHRFALRRVDCARI